MSDILFISILICGGVYDAAAKKIPNIIPLLILLLAGFCLRQTPDTAHSYPSHLAGLFAVSVPLLLLRVLRGGIGGGDIKLTAACGLYLGLTPLLYGTFFAAVSALTVQLLLRIFSHRTTIAHKKNEPKTFAFGPYLALGYLIAVLIF